MRTAISSILLSIFLLSFFTIQPVCSEDRIQAVKTIDQFIPGLTDHDNSKIYRDGKVSRFYSDNKDIGKYLPETSASEKIYSSLSSLEPNIGVESVFLFSAPGIFPGKKTDLDMYNLLRGLRTLKGIQYYSVTHGKIRTLFKDYYRIDSPENKKPLPDTSLSSIPTEETLYALQDDTTFGKSLVRLDYRYNGSVITLSMTNLTVLRYLLLPLIRENNMQMHLLLKIIPGYIIFYGNCGVKSMNFFGLEKNTQDSFSNRIQAMYNWFSGEFTKQILTKN